MSKGTDSGVPKIGLSPRDEEAEMVLEDNVLLTLAFALEVSETIDRAKGRI
jgi:hypothetical protein